MSLTTQAGRELDAKHLGELVAASRTTAVHFVPSMLSVLLETLDPAHWTRVRIVVCGGEALSLDLARSCAVAFPNAELVNVYGTTFKGGVRVAAADLDGDGEAEVLTTAGSNPPTYRLRVLDGLSLTPLDAYFSQAPDFTDARFVAAARFA